MDNILLKTDFADEKGKLIEYEVDNAVIIVNTNTASWVTLSYDEYDIYCDVKNSIAVQSEAVQPLILKLVVNGIIRLKKNIHEPELIKPKINVYYAPTPYCNLRCVYCYAKAEPPQKENAVNADTKASYGILDNILTESVDTVYFTGGEPTLRKDLFDLTDYVQSAGVKVGILTNGTTVNKNNVEKFKTFDRVTISLDASVAEINDITRGEGSFERIVPSIKLLKDNGVNVTITSVISKANIDYVPALLKYIKETLGVSKHKVSLYVSHGRGKDNAETMECSYDEVVTFRSQYIDYQINSSKKGDIISLLQPRLQKRMTKNVCGVASSEIFVDHKGDVYPCRLFENEEHRLGNVRKRPLASVLQDRSTKYFQSRLCVDSIQSCKNCNIKSLCGGGCRSSHACYTGDISISHEPLCEIMRNDIRSAILLDCGFNPVTLKRI